jgi:hypothetical protein
MASLDFYIYGVVGGLTALGIRVGVKRWNESRSSAWPSSYGHIETVDAEANEGHASGYRAVLGFSYHVEGEYYAGFYHRLFATMDKAEQFAEMQKGREVMVRYKPGEPETPVVREADNPFLAEKVKKFKA